MNPLPVTVSITDIVEQKQRRIAWDGKLYNKEEFADWYGEESGLHFWREAPNYHSLYEMVQVNFCHSIQYYPGGGAMIMIEADHGPPRVGTFGVLLPDILLILRVSHLKGKLKPSRLAPEGWQATELWESAIVLGGVSGQISVADFREELYSNGHMAKIGLTKMIRDACDFINFLEDHTDSPDRERLATNLFLKFLCVDVPASLHESAWV